MQNSKLKELITNTQVEDIVLSPKGLLWYAQSEWHSLKFSDPEESFFLASLARDIAESACVHLGPTHPSVDAFYSFSLQHKFRAHVVIVPMVLEGPHITLRRIRCENVLSLGDFHFPEKALQRLKRALHTGESMLIAGATGSGKTSLLNALLKELGPRERILILEDSPELLVPNILSEKLLARSNIFGFRQGAQWELGQLVVEALRMRPDRIVLGECRGKEALAICQALQTGHRGVLTTLHAGSCVQALQRFQALAALASGESPNLYRELWDLVLYLEENKVNQKRELKEIYEKRRIPETTNVSGPSGVSSCQWTEPQNGPLGISPSEGRYPLG